MGSLPEAGEAASPNRFKDGQLLIGGRVKAPVRNAEPFIQHIVQAAQVGIARKFGLSQGDSELGFEFGACSRAQLGQNRADRLVRRVPAVQSH